MPHSVIESIDKIAKIYEEDAFLNLSFLVYFCQQNFEMENDQLKKQDKFNLPLSVRKLDMS